MHVGAIERGREREHQHHRRAERRKRQKLCVRDLKSRRRQPRQQFRVRARAVKRAWAGECLRPSPFRDQTTACHSVRFARRQICPSESPVPKTPCKCVKSRYTCEKQRYTRVVSRCRCEKQWYTCVKLRYTCVISRCRREKWQYTCEKRWYTRVISRCRREIQWYRRVFWRYISVAKRYTRVFSRYRAKKRGIERKNAVQNEKRRYRGVLDGGGGVQTSEVFETSEVLAWSWRFCWRKTAIQRRFRRGRGAEAEKGKGRVRWGARPCVHIPITASGSAWAAARRANQDTSDSWHTRNHTPPARG